MFSIFMFFHCVNFDLCESACAAYSLSYCSITCSVSHKKINGTNLMISSS